MSKHSIVRWIKMIGVYLLVAAVAALGWLWCALPEQVYLEPEQPLMLPRFGWVEPLRGHGSRNVASTRAAEASPSSARLFSRIWFREENAVSDAEKKAEQATRNTSAMISVILPSSIKRKITLNFQK